MWEKTVPGNGYSYSEDVRAGISCVRYIFKKVQSSRRIRKAEPEALIG